MKKEMTILIMIILLLAGFNYWLAGYTGAGLAALSAGIVFGFYHDRRMDPVVVLFVAMFQFTVFCLVAASGMSELIQSGFLFVCFLACLLNSTLLMYSLGLKNCIVGMAFRNIQKLGSVVFVIFVIIAVMMPQEVLQWVGYPQLQSMNRAGLLMMLTLIFVPVLSIVPLCHIKAMIVRKTRLQQPHNSLRNVVK